MPHESFTYKLQLHEKLILLIKQMVFLRTDDEMPETKDATVSITSCMILIFYCVNISTAFNFKKSKRKRIVKYGFTRSKKTC